MDPCRTASSPLVLTVDLLGYARTSTLAERASVEENLIRRYLPLTRGLVSRFIGRGADADDLLQVANLALLKAMRGFDADRGCFEAYAKASISGALKRHLRDQCWTVRPPRRVQELQAQISQATAVMAQHGSTPPTPSTLAQYMEEPVSDITEALSARGCYTPASLDAPFGQAGLSLGDSLCADEDGNDEAMGRITLVQICADLTCEERELIRLRFYECLSQRVIAEELGVSQMQVSRLLAGLMKRLHERAIDPTIA